MKAGRLTKYNDTMQKQAEDYLINHKDVVPSVAALAIELNVAKSTVNKWATEYPIFSDTLEAIKATQERKLLNGGLSGDYNSNIVKLMLCNHGYSDKQQVHKTSLKAERIYPIYITKYPNSDLDHTNID